MSDGIAGGQEVVGVDLHLHRSVIAQIDDHGEQLGWVRIDNDPVALRAECRKAGGGAAVAIEATYGRYWAVDALLAAGFEVHLAHPLGMKALRKRKSPDRGGEVASHAVPHPREPLQGAARIVQGAEIRTGRVWSAPRCGGWPPSARDGVDAPVGC